MLFISLAFSESNEEEQKKPPPSNNSHIYIIASPTYVWLSNKKTSVQNQRVITYISNAINKYI